MIAISRVRLLAAGCAAFGIAFAATACGDDGPRTVPFEELFPTQVTVPGIAPTGPPRATFAPTGDSSDCAGVEAPLADIPGFSPSEPGLRLPKPQGWTRMTQLDSEMVRFTLVNQSLIADKFAPNIVIGVERGNSADSAAVYAHVKQLLIDMGGATDVVETAATVCGMPAQKLTYRQAGMGTQAERHLQTLHILTNFGDTPYLISATAQTTAPDNPTYQRDVSTMFDGFQVLAPASAQ